MGQVMVTPVVALHLLEGAVPAPRGRPPKMALEI